MPARLSSWVWTTVVLVGAITALRVAALQYSKADLFVDEAQYWLWGQQFDLGYYSKPPLIAWVIRVVTDFAGSDSAFWIRMPAPVFHGVTGLVLAAIAARLHSAGAAIWTGVAYVTMPIVTVGSTLISTDTIMAPFLALGLLFYLRLVATRRGGAALLAGAMIGIAFLAKYAAVYFLLGAVLAALFSRDMRISVLNAVLFLVAFLALASPNIYWNFANDLTTAQHTLDNVSWLRRATEGVALNFGALGEFFLSQFLAAGPFLFAVLLAWPFLKGRPKPAGLIWFVLPVVALVCVQALLSRAHANWAFAAYIPGSLLAVLWLFERHRRWLWLSLVLNGAVALALPAITTQADTLTLGRSEPLLMRYLGRDEVSREILDVASSYPGAAIVASDRGILADLFLTGQDAGVAIYSVAPKARPKNYYQQTFPLRRFSAPRALFVTEAAAVACASGNARQVHRIDTAGTAYQNKDLRIFLISGACLPDLK